MQNNQLLIKIHVKLEVNANGDHIITFFKFVFAKFDTYLPTSLQPQLREERKLRNVAIPPSPRKMLMRLPSLITYFSHVSCCDYFS